MMKSNRTALGIFVCLTVAFITAACTGTSGSATATGTSTTAEQSERKNNESQPKSPIRQVDFKALPTNLFTKAWLESKSR